MWHEIFVVQVPVAEKVIRTVLVYATIVLLFRLTGKRGLAGLNRLIARSPRAARLLEGTSTTVIDDDGVVERAVRRLALRPQDLEHAVRVQNGDSIDEMQRGVLEPSGQLILTLKSSEQAATKKDIENVLARLAALDQKLAASTARG